MRQLAHWKLLVVALLWFSLRAAVPGEPDLTSIFPFGGSQGAEFKATIRGRSLIQASAVWFDCEHLSATIAGVENDKSAPGAAARTKKKSSSRSAEPPQLLTLTVKVGPGAEAGLHYLRILTPRGISNALPIRVHPESAISEDAGAHERPEGAQPIAIFPVTINGRLSGSGEVDYYSFEAREGEILRFDALTAGGLDPSLTLFDPTGSWFDPHRLTEIAFNDDDVSYPGFPLHATLTHQFRRKGRYLVQVSGFLGEGGSDHTYQLSIRRSSTEHTTANLMEAAHLPPSAEILWKERSWKRELKPDRLKVLSSRGGMPISPAEKADDGGATQEIPVLRIDEKSQEPVSITLPTLIEGTIEHPANIDRVKFRVKAGDRIAVEVETVQKTIPLFNPYVRIVSATGDEAFTNVHSTVNSCGDTILKQVQPKTTYSFPREGEFILEIRDITHAYGDRTFDYRVLLRRQVPHVGEVHLAEEQINLMAGEVTKVSIDTDQEEGFDGQIALMVEGLPNGVRAILGTELQPQVPPPYNQGKVERFRPESQRATFLFVTDPVTPPTSQPVEARIMAQPVTKGRLGRALMAKKILVTVTHPGVPSAEAGETAPSKAR